MVPNVKKQVVYGKIEENAYESQDDVSSEIHIRKGAVQNPFEDSVLSDK